MLEIRLAMFCSGCRDALRTGRIICAEKNVSAETTDCARRVKRYGIRTRHSKPLRIFRVGTQPQEKKLTALSDK